MSVLEVRRATFSYAGGRPVLLDLSLRLEKGTITAVLGPNGAGKSTLLDVCLGWKVPSKGTVLSEGEPLALLGRAERGRRLSLVPQRENVRFDFLMEDYVLLGRAPHLRPLQAPGARDRAIAARAMAETGVSRLARRSVTTLSGGEYQLMLIARSLAQETPLLLLDEPASQLDPGHQLRVMNVLRRLARRGVTVLLTSHSPQAAASIADMVHLLRAGRFRFSGPPRAVLNAETLAAVYGAPFTVRWLREGFFCSPRAATR